MPIASYRRTEQRSLIPSCLLYAAVGAFIILAACPDMALGYVDPSVVTYAVQAVAGVAVAISAVVGVAFRKARNKIYSVLGFDPGMRKKRDVPFEPVPMGVQEIINMTALETSQLIHGTDIFRRDEANRRVNQDVAKGKFVSALIIALMTVGTLLVVAPLEIVAGSASDFFFTPSDVAPTLVVATIAVSIAIAMVVSLFGRRVFTIVLALVFSLGLCFYLQAMFMNIGLPIADGKTVAWEDYDFITLVSACVWIIVIVAMVVLAWRLPNALQEWRLRLLLC